jgi:hypothetical protein
VHGGIYNKDGEYIPGKDWLSDLGCYEDEKEKYQNIDLNKLEDDFFDDDVNGDFKGDFEDEELDKEELNMMKIEDEMIMNEILKGKISGNSVDLNSILNKQDKTSKKRKNKRNKKKQEDEEWESIDEEEE